MQDWQPRAKHDLWYKLNAAPKRPTTRPNRLREPVRHLSTSCLPFAAPDAQLFYEVTGDGPDVVLLHPFPLNHNFWTPLAEQLATRYRLITPDLRAHGDSELGDGPATMEKLADDLAVLCREVRITKAFFVGVSIGGYPLFEFWRRNREQVTALVLANTRAVRRNARGPDESSWHSPIKFCARALPDSSKRCCRSFFLRSTPRQPS